MNSKMRMKGGKRLPITEEELQNAFKKFLHSGGVIEKLPDEKTAANQKVGAKWSHTEIGGDIPY